MRCNQFIQFFCITECLRCKLCLFLVDVMHRRSCIAGHAYTYYQFFLKFTRDRLCIPVYALIHDGYSPGILFLRL